MSYEDGWAALQLQMPPRVPRTEYSAESHWALVSRVTGIEVSPDSDEAAKAAAAQAFLRAWNYDLRWSTLIGGAEFMGKRTSMGHAAYAAGGVDFNTDIHQLFSEPQDVLRFDPWETFGPIDRTATTRRFEDHYRRACQTYGQAVNMTGVYITCISGLIDLFGWEMLLLAAGTDLAGFGHLTNRYAAWMQQYYDALADADVPVVMSHDDIVWTAGPFLPPDWYRKFVFPNYRRYYQPLIDSGKRILFTSDGNYTAFIDDIAACGVHGFVLEPLTDMGLLASRYGRTHAFIGNADTRVLLGGSRGQIRDEVERCMAIGKACPGFFLAVGNHIPPNTPVENCLYYNEVYLELSRR